MFLPDSYEFVCPVKINSGNRALEHLPVELDALNARKPLVITHKEASQKGLVDSMIDAFKDSGITIGIFDGVPAAPDLPLIRELFHLYRNKGYDAIIALDGGPVSDTAKVLNIAVSGEPEDMEKCAGSDAIKKPVKPLVFIPTLSGGGYETSRYAFFSGRSYSSPYLMPDLVIIDPRMILPESVKTTAAASLIALTHSLEAYISPCKNPLTDSYAYVTIQFIRENLVNVIKNPHDKQGRLALANAHSMAGCVFSNTEAGMAHELGKAAGDLCRISHGLCMGILLPYVTERHALSEEYHAADLLLPMAGMEIYADTPAERRAQKAIDTLYQLQDKLFEITGGAIPRTLKDANIPKDRFKEIGGIAVGDGSKGFDMDSCMAVLEQAWEAVERRA